MYYFPPVPSFGATSSYLCTTFKKQTAAKDGATQFG